MSTPKPTSTQIGTIAENLVANALILESGGRFAPFSPIADDQGIDILVYDKPTGRVIPIQVKARTVTLKRRKSEERGNIAHFEVREAALSKNKRTYLLAVILGHHGTTIDTSWLIPLREFKTISKKRGAKYVIRPNRSRNSTDKFHCYLCESTPVLVERLTKLFDRFDPRWPPMPDLG
jgi:hypothetical protein